MRGAIGGLLRKPSCISSAISTSAHNQTFAPLSSAFSTSSGGDGSGRGRGGGPIASQFGFGSNQPENPESGDASRVSPQSAAPIPGRGHGRGKPLPSSPFLPNLNTFVAPVPVPSPASSASGVGRGRGDAGEESKVKTPVFLSKNEGESSGFGVVRGPVNPNLRRPIGEANLPDNLLGVLSGMGRGQATKGQERQVEKEGAVVEEENRHLRRGRGGFQGPSARARDDASMAPPARFRDDASTAAESGQGSRARKPKFSREDAQKKAMDILSKRDDSGGGESLESDGGSGGRGRRGRVRGRGGQWRGGDREGFGRDEKWRGDRRESDAEEDDEEGGLHLGDNADGEKFAKHVGPEVMNTLTEAFEELSSEVLPSVREDEFVEAFDTNLMIELEPEYLMADFETNPDIDETPPIPLRDALEKMKPFLMVYEGIKSEEEWQEVMEDTMKRVPLLKEIVDHYAGPDSVTAKQQKEELERVAKTLPASTPDSVKQFTDRAILTLQSNPGWGFDKKWQFMDRLVAGVSQVYK